MRTNVVHTARCVGLGELSVRTDSRPLTNIYSGASNVRRMVPTADIASGSSIRSAWHYGWIANIMSTLKSVWFFVACRSQHCNYVVYTGRLTCDAGCHTRADGLPTVSLMIITAGMRMQRIHTTHATCSDINLKNDTHGLMTALNSICGYSGYTDSVISFLKKRRHDLFAVTLRHSIVVHVNIS